MSNLLDLAGLGTFLAKIKAMIASDSKAGLVKTNPSESITADADGTLHVGGRIGQLGGTTGLFVPYDREPRYVGSYSFLVTDAKGMSMNANRSLAIVSGYGLTCQPADAGSTTYRITNNYNNRIIAKMAEGGYASKDEATSTTQQIVRVVSVTINGSTFIPDSTANSSNPIEITVEETLNPDASITSIRLFGTMSSYATAHIGNGVRTESGGRSLMIGGGISKVGSGNDICVVGNAIYTEGNGNAIFGRNHISRKNRWLIAGTGHDTTNGITEAGAVVGQYADVKSDTAFAIGNGTNPTDRRNLFEVNTDGQVSISGLIRQTEQKNLTTKGYVDMYGKGYLLEYEGDTLWAGTILNAGVITSDKEFKIARYSMSGTSTPVSIRCKLVFSFADSVYNVDIKFAGTHQHLYVYWSSPLDKKANTQYVIDIDSMPSSSTANYQDVAYVDWKSFQI